MRVIRGNFAIEVKYAELHDKRLVFKDLDNTYYHTDDYYAENIALGALNDLVINGYIRVKALHFDI